MQFLKRKFDLITEEDGQVFLAVDEHVEHFISDIFDFIAVGLVVQPNENLFLTQQIAWFFFKLKIWICAIKMKMSKGMA